MHIQLLVKIQYGKRTLHCPACGNLFTFNVVELFDSWCIKWRYILMGKTIDFRTFPPNQSCRNPSAAFYLYFFIKYFPIDFALISIWLNVIDTMRYTTTGPRKKTTPRTRKLQWKLQNFCFHSCFLLAVDGFFSFAYERIARQRFKFPNKTHLIAKHDELSEYKLGIFKWNLWTAN